MTKEKPMRNEAYWRARCKTAERNAERMRSLLREVSANRWECATEDGACPDCGSDDGAKHDDGCLLGKVDAEITDQVATR